MINSQLRRKWCCSRIVRFFGWRQVKQTPRASFKNRTLPSAKFNAKCLHNVFLPHSIKSLWFGSSFELIPRRDTRRQDRRSRDAKNRTQKESKINRIVIEACFLFPTKKKNNRTSRQRKEFTARDATASDGARNKYKIALNSINYSQRCSYLIGHYMPRSTFSMFLLRLHSAGHVHCILIQNAAAAAVIRQNRTVVVHAGCRWTRRRRIVAGLVGRNQFETIARTYAL